MNKHEAEFQYWHNQYINKKFNNSWYEYFYTEPFDLTRQDYINKKILDVGCGPAGSLEWISKESKCFGIDPLCNLYYNNFECSTHNMTYIYSRCENIPFPNNYFDYITSMNSMDHVDNVNECILEINRTLKNNGSFLIIVEINHQPRVCEPQNLSENFICTIEEISQLRCMKSKIYGIEYSNNLFKNVKYNVSPDKIGKILLAKFQKK